MNTAMRRAVKKLPGEFFRTITWDQGKEMAKHASFTIDTGIQCRLALRAHSSTTRARRQLTDDPRSPPPPRTMRRSRHLSVGANRRTKIRGRRPRVMAPPRAPNSPTTTPTRMPSDPTLTLGPH